MGEEEAFFCVCQYSTMLIISTTKIKSSTNFQNNLLKKTVNRIIAGDRKEEGCFVCVDESAGCKIQEQLQVFKQERAQQAAQQALKKVLQTLEEKAKQRRMLNKTPTQ